MNLISPGRPGLVLADVHSCYHPVSQAMVEEAGKGDQVRGNEPAAAITTLLTAGFATFHVGVTVVAGVALHFAFRRRREKL